MCAYGCSVVETLKNQLQNDLSAAMRARDEIKRDTLRMAIAAIRKAEVSGKEKVELSDDAVVGVLQAEVRKRIEAADAYLSAGREDRSAKERAEAEVLSAYLPAALDDEALFAVVAEEVAVAQAEGLSGGKAMGSVVKAVRERAGAGTDGGRIAAAVKSALT